MNLVDSEKRYQERQVFEKAIVVMFQDRISGANFWARLLANVKTSVNRGIRTLGVYFKSGTYYLDVNVDFFNSLTELEQIAVLKHEMSHILHKHLTTRGNFAKHEQANIAMDMAINQHIPDLPKNAIDYRRYKFPAGLNTEQYYDLLDEDEEFQEEQREQEARKEAIRQAIKDALEKGQIDENGNPVDGNGNPIEIPVDGHAEHNWDDISDEDKELLESITKDLIEKAMEKAIGRLPHNISELLNMFNNKPQVNWRKALKKMVGNKKANKRSTIKRNDRRFPTRDDLRGKTKDSTFELVCLLDVSGSMSDNEILVPLQEIREICKMTNTNMKVIQVDTNVKTITDFDKNTKSFTRSGAGGTYMYDGIRYLYENKIKHDGIVFISDLYIESIEACWEIRPRVPIFWLTATPEDSGEQVQNYPRMKRFLIDVKAT